jgi:hypothetical protein
MAAITKSGHYYRLRCVVCRKYMLTRRRHAATCGATCRQRRLRSGEHPPAEFVEHLGWLSAGARVSGILRDQA